MFGNHTEHLYYLIMRDLTQGSIIGHLLRRELRLRLNFASAPSPSPAPAPASD